MRALRDPGRLLVAAAALSLAMVFGGVAPPRPAGADLPPADGYWLLTGGGGVVTFNTMIWGAPASDPARCPVSPFGAARAPAVDGSCWTMAATPNGHGYWIMNSLTGAIYRYGNAGFFGEPKTRFAGVPSEFVPVMRQIVSTPDGSGYWVYEVGASGAGTVDHYGNAGFFGDTQHLAARAGAGSGFNGLPVGLAATRDGKGYWEAHSDGGVFAFGSARFLGSMGGVRLVAPVVGIEATPSGRGYWLVASDGGVFAFGDARFAGSMAGLTHKPIVGIARNPVGPGYWLASDNGQVFTFGGATFFGAPAMFGEHPHVFTIVTRKAP